MSSLSARFGSVRFASACFVLAETIEERARFIVFAPHADNVPFRCLMSLPA